MAKSGRIPNFLQAFSDASDVAPLTLHHIEEHLRNMGVSYVVRRSTSGDGAASARVAAESFGVEGWQILKSVCFVTPVGPVLVVVRGIDSVEVKALSAILGVSRTHVKSASSLECVALFGFPPGGVAPCALRTSSGVRVIVDEAVVAQSDDRTILFGGGDTETCIEVSQRDLVSKVFKGHPVHAVARQKVTKTGGTSADPSGRAPMHGDAPVVLRFMADSMLGRVAKWLRCLGVDTELVTTKDDVALLSRAAVEHRVVLTADRKLAAKLSNVFPDR